MTNEPPHSPTGPGPEPPADQPAPVTSSRPKSGRWKWWLLVLAAFFLGIGLGVAGSVTVQLNRMKKIMSGEPAVKAERIVNMLDRRLDLTDEQVERITPIVRNAQEQMVEIHVQVRPEVATVIVTAVEQIQDVTTDEQDEKLDAMIRRYEKLLETDLTTAAEYHQAEELMNPQAQP